MGTLLYYANIYLVPVIVVAVLFFSVKNRMRNFIGRRYFRGMLLAVELGILTLIVSWAPVDTPLGWLCNWVGSASCLVFIVVACYIWLLYVICQVEQTEDLRPYKKRLMVAGAPLLVYLLLLVTSPWHVLLFSVAEDGGYGRGTVAWLPYAIAVVYLFYSSGLAWGAANRELLQNRKHTYLNLTYFGCLPIVGLAFQSITFEYPFAVPLAVLALLIMYFNMLKGYSSLDPLTNLNNRRQFDRYLAARLASPGQGDWCLLMIDLDGFKQINDVLGHTVGDRALVDMAQLLRASFQEERAFLARYGGDEFVAVVTYGKEGALAPILGRLETNVAAYNRRPDVPFALRYSLGCAVYGRDARSADELLRVADDEMYRRKRARKEAPLCVIKGGCAQ